MTGRPYSKSLLLHDEDARERELIAYHDGMIVHDLDPRTIRLLSVVDGPIATYRTQNRELFYMVALSCMAVAAVTKEG